MQRAHEEAIGAALEKYLGVTELIVAADVVNTPFRGLLGTVSSNFPQLKKRLSWQGRARMRGKQC